MIDLELIEKKNLNLRSEGASVEGNTVVQVELLSDDEHSDFYSAVIETPEGEFWKLFFNYEKFYDEFSIHGEGSGIIAPVQVTPQEKITIVYV